jgi:hypothetical protein
MSTFSFLPPAANDIITVNLPTPISSPSTEGLILTFRKLRGSINQTTPNWQFTTVTPIILPLGNSLTGGGGANSSSSRNSNTVMYVIVLFGGVYYYVEI